jgi:hypothetical protein
VKEIIGVDFDINISVDTRPIKNGFAESGWIGATKGIMSTKYAMSVEANADVGLASEGAIAVGITGSDGGVVEGTGIDLIGIDNVQVNYGVVIPPGPKLAGVINGSTTLDPNSNNGVASSQSWTVGGGIGSGQLCVTAAHAQDWFYYGNKSTNQVSVQIPFGNSNFANLAIDKFYDVYDRLVK